MSTITVVGFSHWASALINNDFSGLDQDDIDDLQDWLAFEGVENADCVDAVEIGFVRDVNGIGGDASEFTFILL